MQVPRFSVGVFILAIIVGIAKNEAVQKSTYSSMFTESTSSGSVKHPGNAFSSSAYLILAVWLATRKHASMKWSRQSDAAVLAWLSVVSFRFHATESLWIETQDLWCVIYLCLACVARYTEKNDNKALLLTWLAMFMLIVDAFAQNINNSIIQQHYFGIVGVLVYLLLRYSLCTPVQFVCLFVGFAVKLIDILAAQDSMHTSSWLNGTSLFHILTAVALYKHYNDEVIGTVEH